MNFKTYLSKVNISLIFTFGLVYFSFGQNATDGGTIGNDQDILIGIYPDTIRSIVSPSGGDPSLPLEYIWLQGPNTFTFPDDWTIAEGIHNQPYYVPPILSEDTYYVRGARRQGFSEYQAGSNIVSIKVTESQLISGGIIGSDQTIDPGEIPDTIYSIEAAIGVDSNLVIEYFWAVSSVFSHDIGDFNPAPGNNKHSFYVPPNLYSTSYFIREARIKGLIPYLHFSNLVAINLNPAPPVNTDILDISIPKIFPNPITNYLQIEFKENSSPNWLVEIFDIKGSLQKTISLENVNPVETINLQDLAKGTYLIQLTDLKNNKVESFKILKE